MSYHVFHSDVVSGGQLFEVQIYVEQSNPVTGNCEVIERWTCFFVPDSVSRKKEVALLIAYHGADEDGQTFRRRTTGLGYDQEASKEGMIVAYPDGYQRYWNEYVLKFSKP